MEKVKVNDPQKDDFTNNNISQIFSFENLERSTSFSDSFSHLNRAMIAIDPEDLLTSSEKKNLDKTLLQQKRKSYHQMNLSQDLSYSVDTKHILKELNQSQEKVKSQEKDQKKIVQYHSSTFKKKQTKRNILNTPEVLAPKDEMDTFFQWNISVEDNTKSLIITPQKTQEKIYRSIDEVKQSLKANPQTSQKNIYPNQNEISFGQKQEEKQEEEDCSLNFSNQANDYLNQSQMERLRRQYSPSNSTQMIDLLILISCIESAAAKENELYEKDFVEKVARIYSHNYGKLSQGEICKKIISDALYLARMQKLK